MVTTIKKGTKKDVIQKSMQKSEVKKGFDSKKHIGSIKSVNNPLEIQKKLRSEWS